MRHFAFFDESGLFLQSVSCEGVPGPGGVLPSNGVEIDEEKIRELTVAPGARYVDGVVVPPAPKAPTVLKTQFLLLFTAEQRAAIRTYRRDRVDDEVEDFYELLQLAGTEIDLGHPIVTTGLSLLVSKGLLTVDEATRIASGTAPEARGRRTRGRP